MAATDTATTVELVARNGSDTVRRNRRLDAVARLGAVNVAVTVLAPVRVT